MLSRISTRTTAMTSLTNLQASQARSHKLQEQLTSGKSMTKPSDNPVAAETALRTRTEIAVNEQHGRNIADAQTWLDVQEGALDSTLGALQRVRDLTVQAANSGAMSETARKGIATQIRALKETILGEANTEHLGRPVFGGTRAGIAAAFGPDGAYLGDPADATTPGEFRRQVGPGVDMTVNIAGPVAFGSTVADLEELAALLESPAGGDGAAVSARIGTVDAALDRVKGALTTIGARGNQLQALRERAEIRGDALATALDDVEGIDMARTMVEYSVQSTAYQAALAATAKVVQPTLLDFLR